MQASKTRSAAAKETAEYEKKGQVKVVTDTSRGGEKEEEKFRNK